MSSTNEERGSKAELCAAERERLSSMEGAVDDYLWNPNAAPDADVARMEELLRPYADRDVRVDATRHTPMWSPVVAVAATALLAVGAGVWLVVGSSRLPTKENAAVQVGRRVEWTMIDASGGVPGHLSVGAWLETRENERVRLDVADIGAIDVHAGSRLRIVESHDTAHRIELAHGTLDAVVNAPPRLFVVDTPSAKAVDLGCAYTLTVDHEKRSHLNVRTGSVSLEGAVWRVYVPAGAVCVSTASEGPGLAWFEGADPKLRTCVQNALLGKQASIDDVIKRARPRDGLSLFQALPRVPSQARRALAQALAHLVPPPDGVSLDAVVKLDARALSSWWDEIELCW